ncbi:MAG: hypothetical protein JW913_09940 [Chitinispirillaceae bacterium]|nr:hypothetical protein [Chitinispirillaceae bacterium]
MTSKQLDFSPYIMILLKRRIIILLHLALIIILSAVYAFVIVKKQYRSEAVFLPPVTNDNALGISGILDFSASSLFSNNVMSEQIETIFWSRQLRAKIIDRFKLYNNYQLDDKKNKFERALKILAKALFLESNEKGGFAYSKILSFTIVSYHTSPDTARLMAEYTYFLVDSTVKTVSIDRASRNRLFIGRQLSDNKIKFDSLQSAFSKFQTDNKAYDIPQQLKLSLGIYADLKSEEVLNELRIKALEYEFSANTPEMLDLKSSSRVLRDRLKKFESGYDTDVLPSLERATKLLPEYFNLFRDLEVQEKLILLLTKEYEQAKLQESKDVSPLIILDVPMVPEYKSKPKRILLMAMIIVPYMAALFFFLLAQEYFRIHVRTSPAFQSILEELK